MIKFENVSKSYKGEKFALEDINIDIKKGEFVFLVGSSGAGKSTFIKLLLKEESPTTGRIIINDIDTTELSRRKIPKLRRSMGVVFQDFRLLPNKTVYENIAFAMEITGNKAKDIRRKVPTILSMVGLSDKAKSYPSELSGGEQQRVGIARAIINNPALLIADEPTGNLDDETAKDIIAILKRMALDRQKCVIVVTHSKEVAQASDVVLELKKKQLIEKKK